MSTDQSAIPAEYSIVVDGLTKTYGDFKALDRVSFEVQPGEIVGFLGPNGAGKSTTMKILTCFMAATEGTAKVAGYDVHAESAEVRKRVGYLPENVPLYDEMLVWDYLKFIAEVRGVAKPAREERIEEVIERTGLHNVVHKEISELSKGYRQRVGLAQAIIHKPEVLILDEPTTGLDPNQIIEIRDVISEIGEEKTVIFSTHILQEIAAVCDRIVIINRGRLVADGTLDALQDAVGADGLEDVFRHYTAGETEEGRSAIS
jgi:ABC-2 type transport system ATP-binding protein